MLLRLPPNSQTAGGTDVRSLHKVFGTCSCLEQACGVSALEIQTLQMSRTWLQTQHRRSAGCCRGLWRGVILVPSVVNTFLLSQRRQKMPRLWQGYPGTDTSLEGHCTARTETHPLPPSQGGWGPPLPPKPDVFPREEAERSHPGKVCSPLQTLPSAGSAFQEETGTLDKGQRGS